MYVSMHNNQIIDNGDHSYFSVSAIPPHVHIDTSHYGSLNFSLASMFHCPYAREYLYFTKTKRVQN